MNAKEAYKKCYSDIRYHDTIPLEARDGDDLNASLREYPKFIQDAAWDAYFKRHREFTGFRGRLRNSLFWRKKRNKHSKGNYR